MKFQNPSFNFFLKVWMQAHTDGQGETDMLPTFSKLGAKLTHKAQKKAEDKMTSAKFRKTFNRNCIMLKNQRLECKHCRSR